MLSPVSRMSFSPKETSVSVKNSGSSVPRTELSAPGMLSEPSDRDGSAILALSHLADLLANVQFGLVKNQDKHGPAVANQRLVSTAAGLVEDIASASFGDSKPSPANQYAERAGSLRKLPDHRRNARDFLGAASLVLKSLQPSTNEEVDRAIAVLGGLEHRARGLIAMLEVMGNQVPLDQSA